MSGTVLESWMGQNKDGGHVVNQSIVVVFLDDEVLYHVVHTDSYAFKSIDEAQGFAARTRQAVEKRAKVKLHKQTVAHSGE